MLTNAIYFKGDWDVQFDRAQTRSAPFYLSDGTSADVETMAMPGGRFGLREAPEAQVLELPYAGEELSMLVLLPRQRDGLAALEQNLDADTLAGWLQPVTKREVDVFLPRFSISSGFSLGDMLSGLGMRSAFVPGQADFSGMNGRMDLYISEAVHKAFVEVNEEGTEAAAATGIVVGIESIRETPVFRADHPFLFLIRDNRSGSILFLGRLADPRDSG